MARASVRPSDRTSKIAKRLFDARKPDAGQTFPLFPVHVVRSMEDLTKYRNRPLAFFGRYIMMRRLSHAAILMAVVSAVGFSVTTQYGIKYLVDTLSAGAQGVNPWLAFYLLVLFVAADNLLWRVASWIATYTFVQVTGDLRADLFRYLTGHAPSYFAKRLPGVLTSRITATSNAIFTIENMCAWNILPPCIATVGAIAFLSTVSVWMAAFLAIVSGIVVGAIFRIAAAGKPLHHDFAEKAAAVDGEMIDVIGNIGLVKAFGGLLREHGRFSITVNQELTARRQSLLYLEKLRLMHAFLTVILMLGLLAWAIRLWQQKSATAGDVILVCTLEISVLSATRDLAVALVDATQHMARLSEALATLLCPHELRDHPQAAALVPSGARGRF